MKGYLPTKNLIFFNPGKSGMVLIHPANHYISVERLLKTQESLVQKTDHPVVYIEDRRGKPRQKREMLTGDLSMGRVTDFDLVM
ncbi:hypothetical protein [Desulfobacula sp.]|uniref:hypothetical protein n=1 Tax=Desulfobacula sp. TaxID=2593537 RepID=UPI00263223E4|nr:hypothetical protein [Desulfobacula sp.]